MKNRPAYRKLLRRNLERKRFDVVSEKDFTVLFQTDTILVDEAAKPILVYLENPYDTHYLGEHLRFLRYEKSGRTNGLPTTSRVFGYQPRVTIRRDFCNAASLNNENPHAYSAIRSAAILACEEYKKYNPELFAAHMKQAEKLRPEWRISKSHPYTSGIVNRNNQLRYHYDAGNFKGVWSAMFVFKKDVKGGYLSVPEYDCGFELKNGSLLMFDGQALLHGVTPIRLMSPQAYRISVVYYTLAGLWKCLTPANELARIRKVKTEREKKRAAR